MRTIARQGVALVAAAGALAASALLVAPPAWAATPIQADVHLSSPTNTAGSALVVYDQPQSNMYVDIYFPETHYGPKTSSDQFNYGPCAPATIASYGFSMLVDGDQVAITDCQFSDVGSDYELYVGSAETGTSACLVWNSNLMSVTTPLAPVSIYPLSVTPTTSGSDCSVPAFTSSSPSTAMRAMVLPSQACSRIAPALVRLSQRPWP